MPGDGNFKTNAIGSRESGRRGNRSSSSGGDLRGGRNFGNGIFGDGEFARGDDARGGWDPRRKRDVESGWADEISVGVNLVEGKKDAGEICPGVLIIEDSRERIKNVEPGGLVGVRVEFIGDRGPPGG